MIENVYRSSNDKWLGGVAAGLAERFELPTFLVRAIFVILGLLFHVATVLVYLALWLAVPEHSIIEVENGPETAPKTE